MKWAKTSTGLRCYFSVDDGKGRLTTGAIATDFTVTVVNPGDTATLAPAVSETASKAGLYTFLITSAFVTTHGIGEYGVTIEVNAASLPGPRIRAVLSETVKISTKDFEDVGGGGGGGPTAEEIADQVWEEAQADHTAVGTMGGQMAAAVTQTADIDEQVLDVAAADHNLPGTIGEKINTGGDGSGGGGGCIGSGSILVDQDYGGTGRLCYMIDGTPVDNADISIYLAADWNAGNRSVEDLQAFTRTTVTGGWLQGVMLDAETYIIVFSKQQVAGPDVFQLTVTEDPTQSTLTRITPDPDQVAQEQAQDNSPPPAPAQPTVESCPPTEGLDDFGGTGQITVDQNYGGAGNLCYAVNGQFVNGAEILIFPRADWDAGNRQNRFSIAASRTLSDGSWEQPVKIDPGDYVVQFFKAKVAGPDAYYFTASDPPTAAVSLASSPPPPAPAPVPTPTPDPVDDACENLEGLSGDGSIAVDQNYGGPNALCYTLNDQPVAGVEILFFTAADYNAGNRQSRFAVAASVTQADGSWVQAVMLDPGDYYIQFFKAGVAGPDSFPLTVA